jgi:hypothetical protein
MTTYVTGSTQKIFGKPQGIRVRNCFMLLFCLIQFAGNGVCAHQDQELFLKAQNQYEEGDYERAHATYALMEKKEFNTLCNMGATAYALQRYPEAIFIWSAALKNAPTRFDASIIDRYINHACKKSDTPYAHHWLFMAGAYTRWIPLLAVQLGCLLSLLLLIGALKRRSSFLLVIALFTLAMQASFFGVRYATQIRKKIFIIDDLVPVRAGPGHSYHIITTVAPTTSHTLLATHGRWYKMEYQGLSGWVDAQNCFVA